MEIIRAPHHELSYDEGARRDVNSFTIEEIKTFDKQTAVQYARAKGLLETGMSVNEVALLYDLLEEKKPKMIVELGRNYGCSTRLFLQCIVRHGGFLESWDLKHWGDLNQTFKNQGFHVVPTSFSPRIGQTEPDFSISMPEDSNSPIAVLKIGDTRRDHITPTERWIDFLLVDTEHGMEDALGEVMRFRTFLKGGAMIAFHDSTLSGVSRAIEVYEEVEATASPGRIVRKYVNEREDGFGICILEWKG